MIALMTQEARRSDGEDELQAAFDYAAEYGGKRGRRRDDRPAAGMDRRIYGVNGLRTVRGGAPGQRRGS